MPLFNSFNTVVGFGTEYQALFSESREYGESSFKAASNYIGDMGADKGPVLSTSLVVYILPYLGGTELLAPLEWVFRNKADFEFPRQVFVLTDGQISNNDEVLNLVKCASGTLFLFFLFYELIPLLQECIILQQYKWPIKMDTVHIG